MNLQEFIDYRDTCPICDNKLSLIFQSRRKQIVTYNQDSISFNLKLLSLRGNSHKYSISYNLNRFDDNFCIDFFEKDLYLEQVYLSTIKCFKTFRENLKVTTHIYLYKYCDCNLYNYRIKASLDYKKSIFKIDSFNLEFFDLYYNGYNYKLYNYVDDNKSHLIIFELDKNRNYDYEFNNIIKFTNVEDTAVRIKKLLIFS